MICLNCPAAAVFEDACNDCRGIITLCADCYGKGPHSCARCEHYGTPERDTTTRAEMKAEEAYDLARGK